MPVRLDLSAISAPQPAAPSAPSLAGKFGAAMGNASAARPAAAGTSLGGGLPRGLTLAQQKALSSPGSTSTPAATPTATTPPLTTASGYAGLSAGDKQKVQDSVVQLFASVDNGIAMGGNFQGVGLDKE